MEDIKIITKPYKCEECDSEFCEYWLYCKGKNERQQTEGGDIWISEISEAVGKHGLVREFYFENLQDFILDMSVEKKI